MNAVYRSCAYLCVRSIDLVSKFSTLLSVFLALSIGMMTSENGTAVVREAPQESQFGIPSTEKLKKFRGYASVFHNAQLMFPPIGPSPVRAKPPSGAKAEIGRRTKMEDTYAIHESFLDASPKRVVLAARFPFGMEEDVIQHLTSYNPDRGGHRVDTMYHYYAVFDGHGGAEASDLCASRMHENIREAWNNLPIPTSASLKWSGKACSNNALLSNDYQVSICSEDIVDMFEKAFAMTDDDLKKSTEKSSATGSTAVVALIGENTVIVGYCGDSRAVLSRAGQAFALTIDHKPEREDETDRVQKAGGHVLFFNGPRVMGLLAMSRAIGDLSLRPYVISRPDVCLLPRSQEDEILILATDGLWDVLTNQEACTLALKCLERAKEKGVSPADAAKVTATVLTRAAVDRGSRDNITVLVIDLRPQSRYVEKVDSGENDSPCNAPDAPIDAHTNHN